MLTVNISEFRSKLLKYLDKANKGEEITVTSNGKVLATISAPADQKALARRQLAEIAAQAKVHDIVSPTTEQWDAMS